MSSTGISETTVGLTVHLQLRENIRPFGASLIAQLVKNLPAMQEIPVRIPGSGRSPGEQIDYPLQYSWASLVAQLVKNLPEMQEIWV